jgi:Sec-independent protein secretion pathway component TatC
MSCGSFTWGLKTIFGLFLIYCCGIFFTYVFLVPNIVKGNLLIEKKAKKIILNFYAFVEHIVACHIINGYNFILPIVN